MAVNLMLSQHSLLVQAGRVSLHSARRLVGLRPSLGSDNKHPTFTNRIGFALDKYYGGAWEKPNKPSVDVTIYRPCLP